MAAVLAGSALDASAGADAARPAPRRSVTIALARHPVPAAGAKLVLPVNIARGMGLSSADSPMMVRPSMRTSVISDVSEATEAAESGGTDAEEEDERKVTKARTALPAMGRRLTTTVPAPRSRRLSLISTPVRLAEGPLRVMHMASSRSSTMAPMSQNTSSSTAGTRRSSIPSTPESSYYPEDVGGLSFGWYAPIAMPSPYAYVAASDFQAAHFQKMAAAQGHGEETPSTMTPVSTRDSAASLVNAADEAPLGSLGSPAKPPGNNYAVPPPGMRYYYAVPPPPPTAHAPMQSPHAYPQVWQPPSDYNICPMCYHHQQQLAHQHQQHVHVHAHYAHSGMPSSSPPLGAYRAAGVPCHRLAQTLPAPAWAPYREAQPQGRVTTIMLRNIPQRYTRDMLLKDMEERGFAGSFDFMYLPIDFSTTHSVGYAFINFISEEALARFRKSYEGLKLLEDSPKVCQVGEAKVQGKSENIEYYRNSTVMGMEEQYHPVVYENSVRVAFPPPTRPLGPVQHRPPRVRAHM